MESMNINNNMSQSDDLYGKILAGMKIIHDSFVENDDGTLTLSVDLSDDAAKAWEDLYGIPVSVGFNTWFNDLLKNAMDHFEQKKSDEVAGSSSDK